MTRQWTNQVAANDWYTAANWDPATPFGGWLVDDIAAFHNTGSAVQARIDMSIANLSLGAITVSSRTRNLTVGNSSHGTITGHLQLNGATVNGVPNVILSADAGIPSSKLIIKHRLPHLDSLMEIVLGNSVNNVILVNNEEGSAIDIDAPITGADKKLTMNNIGTSGGVLTLSGANTYTGTTHIGTRHGTLVLARPGGGTLPSGNNVEIGGGRLLIKTNQTLRNVHIGHGGALEVAPGAKLTITGGVLYYGTITNQEGYIKGTVVFA